MKAQAAKSSILFRAFDMALEKVMNICIEQVLVVAWARVPHWSCWHSCDVMPEGLT